MIAHPSVVVSREWISYSSVMNATDTRTTHYEYEDITHYRTSVQYTSYVVCIVLLLMYGLDSPRSVFVKSNKRRVK